MFSEWMIPIAVMLLFGQTAPPAEAPEQPTTTMPAEAQEQPTTMPAEAGAEAEPEELNIDTFDVSLSGNEIAVETLDADTLILKGTDTDLKALEDFLRVLDRGSVPPKIEFFQLQHAQAKDLAQKIQAQLREIRQATGRKARPEDFVSVQADPRTNTLIVVASETMMNMVRDFVQRLDQEAPAVGQLDVKIFTLKHIPPSKMKEQIENVLKQFQEMRGDTGPLPFNIQADDRLNELRIYLPGEARPGVQQDLKTIEDLISRLDVEPAALSKLQMVVVQLRNAEASKLADALDEMIKSPTEQASIKEQISRLRMLRQTKEGELEPLPELDLEKPIRIIPAADVGNALIVGTVEENIPAVLAIINLLDMVPLTEEMSIRLFPLKYADAKATADLLKELFKQGQELPKHPSRAGSEKAVPEGVAGKALVYNVGVHADAQTNTIIVSGRIEQVLLAQQIVSDIDVPGTAKFPFEIIELTKAGATRVAAILTELLDKRLDSLKARGLGASAVENERIFIATERRSNSLIVSAKPGNFEEIAAIVKRLDEAPDRLADQIRIITLEKTNAVDLAERIQELFTKRQGTEEKEDAPVIIADPRSNSLVLASTPEDYNAIKSVIEKLEAQEISPLSEFRLVKLGFNDASEVAKTMEDLFKQRAEMRTQKGQEVLPSDKVAIGVDSATNSLIVVSSQENFDVLTRLVKEIDIEIDAEGLVQTFQLHNANADDVAERIKNLWDQGIYKPGTVESEVQKRLDKIAVVADPRANAVIVSASRPNFSIIKRLVETLDADPARLLARMRIFKLEYADAVKMADVLTQYFDGVRAQIKDQNVFPEPTVIPDERSNSVIIAGSNDALTRAEEMIGRLDVESQNPTAELKVYTLQHASGVKLAPMIKDLFEKRKEGTEQAKRTPFQIMADEATNSLIVSAAREDQITLTNMLVVLDKPSTLDRQMRIFSLTKARAASLAQTLDDLFQKQAKGREGGADTTGIAITPDERTNSLVVWASPSDLENIEKIVERLDSTEPRMELMVRIVRLKQSMAEDLAAVLNDALGGTGAGHRTGEGGTSHAGGALGAEDRAVLISFLDVDEEGREYQRKLLRQDLTIVPDTRTNSIIIVAPPDSVEMLESLIHKLDARPESLDIRVFPLQNANAEDMKALLDELFQTQERQRPQGEEERRFTFGPEGAAPAVGGAALEGEGGRQELSFTVDKRTNALIAAGTEQYLELVEKLVYDLDSQDITERVGVVYQIRHNTAEDLSGALESYFQAESTRYERLGDQTALARQIEREVSVIPSTETNSLLLNFDPRRESEVMQLVRQLDRPPPQVMIQVLLAEVTLDDRLELGMEFALQDLEFSRTQVNGFGPNHDWVLGTDLGAAGTGLGGFSFTITSEDFNFLLRMLQSEGRLVVLSRPMITAQDNREARIEVADRVPFVRGVTVSDTGATQTQVEYQEVGIILQVTPHINPDGFVTLEIHPEISNFTDSTITITEGVSAPIFNSRSADTTLTVKDGETIVIGGLIQHRDEDGENKVPVVGDIPYLGALLRSTRKHKQKNELLIVVTPRVMWSVEDARDASQHILSQHSFPESTMQSDLWENLQTLPGQEGIGPPQKEGGVIIEPLEQTPPEEEYKPLPDVYGPVLPDRMSVEGARDGDPKMVGPPLYEDYLQQRR